MKIKFEHNGKTFVLASNRLEYQIYEEKLQNGEFVKSNVGNYYKLSAALKNLFVYRLPKASYARTKDSFLAELRNLAVSVSKETIRGCINELEKENFDLQNKLLDSLKQVEKLKLELKK